MYFKTTQYKTEDVGGGVEISLVSHGSPCLPAFKGKSEGLVMPRTEWHGEVFYWGKSPTHACMETRTLNR